MQPMRPAERFARALLRHGVEYLFGQSNPPSLTLAAADLGIEQIGYRQENAGTYMADGYARATGKVPVVTAQNGPAATLLVAGLAECLSASIPIVAIVQDVGPRARDRNAFQELDQLELFKGVAKWIKRIDIADRIEDYVDMAFAAAASGRPGPAVLLVSMELLADSEERPPAPRRMRLGHYPLDRTQADPQRIAEAAVLIANARAPIVYAGGGVIGSGAQQELRALQEGAHLPVATSTMGKGGVDETHPLSIGVIGYYMAARGMTRFAKPLITEADVILLIGNRTNQNGTDSWKLLPRDASYIHIDIDPLEIGRNYEALRLTGDAKLTLSALNATLAACELTRRREGRAALEATIAASKLRHREEIATVTRSDAAPIRPERFMAELEQQLADDHIVVADASFSSIWVANYLTAKGRRRFITPRGQAGLGWGFPLAMGARLGNPATPVVCIVGDGGFGHVWSELETAKRHGIRVVIAVMNNAVLGYQLHSEDAFLGRHTNVCKFEPVDHAAIARACGVQGIRLEKAQDTARVIREALATDESVLIDVIADPQAMPPVPVFSRLPNY
ncbi:acetolactate synthase-1/2/3 large subunit [Povalibacter uvarum]|uniref:Acetolactate synthase-1/2/3 large subunit n=1 Tax=Povalibacter uvarum TaxID=732238 RepID=A0A841HJC7_9GAMM|nr:acetolactate synthase catalytic subunit [Povalibacter uvarum]MBB6092410.1 acetolactate synthase-1/2/3 large subunit [Povalibacter uvarum]